MRVNKIVLTKTISDPKTHVYGGQTFASDTDGASFDLYAVNDTFYIVRDGEYIAIVAANGTAYVSGGQGKKIAGQLATKFPRASED